MRAVVALLAACAVALVAVELGMGALDFGEARLADPCTTKPKLSEGGFFGSIDAAVQRFGLSGLNGAACSLRSRPCRRSASRSRALWTGCSPRT